MIKLLEPRDPIEFPVTMTWRAMHLLSAEQAILGYCI